MKTKFIVEHKNIHAGSLAAKVKKKWKFLSDLVKPIMHRRCLLLLIHEAVPQKRSVVIAILHVVHVHLYVPNIKNFAKQNKFRSENSDSYLTVSLAEWIIDGTQSSFLLCFGLWVKLTWNVHFGHEWSKTIISTVVSLQKFKEIKEKIWKAP